MLLHFWDKYHCKTIEVAYCIFFLTYRPQIIHHNLHEVAYFVCCTLSLVTKQQCSRLWRSNYSLWCQNIPLSTPIQRFHHHIKSFPFTHKMWCLHFHDFKAFSCAPMKSFGIFIIPSTIVTNYITRIGVDWPHIYRNRWWMSCSGGRIL